MFEAISGLSAAFGLSGSAGLNAYIPLLVVALAARFPMSDPLVKLQAPFDLLGSWWAIGLIAVLLVIEIVADKIPAIDSINDGIQTFIRPAAGAILFAGSANVITDIHPILSLGAGLLALGRQGLLPHAAHHGDEGVAREALDELRLSAIHLAIIRLSAIDVDHARLHARLVESGLGKQGVQPAPDARIAARLGLQAQ